MRRYLCGIQIMICLHLFLEAHKGSIIASGGEVQVTGEIMGTWIGTSCHVKLPSAFRDFFQSTLFFLPHRTSTLSLNRSLMSPYSRVSMLLHPPVGHRC